MMWRKVLFLAFISSATASSAGTLTVKGGDIAVAFSQDGSTITFTITAQLPSVGWVGIGINDNEPEMDGSDIAMAVIDGSSITQVYDCRSSGHKRPSLDSSQDLTFIHGLVAGSTVVVSFSRPLITGDSEDVDIKIDGSNQYVIWAMGPGAGSLGDTEEHSDQAAWKVNFKSGEWSSAQVSASAIWKAHGILMIASWGILLPVGTAVAKLGRAWKGWFNLHMHLQVLGVLVASAGIVIGFLMVETQWRNPVHANLGVVILVLGALQLLAAFLRPHPNESGRNLWLASHVVIAAAGLIIAIYNIFEGLKLYRVTPDQRLAFSVWIVLLCCVGFAVKIAQIIVAKAKGSRIQPQ